MIYLKFFFFFLLQFNGSPNISDTVHTFSLKEAECIFVSILISVICSSDLYYYLKDPPPGFLPRFGTITVAGLLGMFLARKGNLN